MSAHHPNSFFKVGLLGQGTRIQVLLNMKGNTRFVKGYPSRGQSWMGGGVYQTINRTGNLDIKKRGLFFETPLAILIY
jgi:hypothetical protein